MMATTPRQISTFVCEFDDVPRLLKTHMVDEPPWKSQATTGSPTLSKSGVSDESYHEQWRVKCGHNTEYRGTSARNRCLAFHRRRREATR